MNNMIVQSSSSSTTTTNINGHKTINSDSSSNFKRTNSDNPEKDLEVRKKGHFDMSGNKGRFHKNKSFREKLGTNPTEGFLRKEQGNLEDGIRRDVMDVDTGEKRFKIDLHSALKKIKAIKSENTKTHFSESNESILSHIRDLFAAKFGKGGNSNDSH